MKTCVWCDEPLAEGTKGTVRYCSDECRTKKQKQENARKVAEWRAKKEAAAAAAGGAQKDAGPAWCPAEHATWASKAACLYPGYKVRGNGQYMTWHPSWGNEIRLWVNKADARAGTPSDGQLVVLHRRPHIKGGNRK